MIFEINFTHIITIIILWIYAIQNLNSAIKQIDNVTTSTKITNKTKVTEFFDNLVNIIYFPGVYLTGTLTATNMISLKYFVIFVIIHSLIRILYGFRKYPDNIKVYSIWEIYINMILYLVTVFWMVFLWWM